jgi:hypothetical protein
MRRGHLPSMIVLCPMRKLARQVEDIRDFGSKVIWFYVLTFLEPLKTCAEIKN